MTNKILQIGSSAGITLPKELLKDLGLRIGDRFDVQYEKRERTIRLRPARKFRSKISRKTQNYIEEFFKQYDADLKRLAQS